VKAAIIAIALLTGPAAADPPAEGLIALQAIDSAAAQGLVRLSGGRLAGVRLGQPAWVIAEGRVIADGRIRLVTDDTAVLRLQSGRVVDGAVVVVMPADLPARRRDLLPEEVTIRARLTRVAPGRGTAWIDAGTEAGLTAGDRVLIRRNGIPIAVGEVALAEPELALVSLEPVVSNALSEAGDDVELWPAPALRRQGRVDSTVLAVEPGPDGERLTLVGNAADGLVPGRQADLFRGGRYLAMAVVTAAHGPLSRAQILGYARADAPAEGDTALLRAVGGQAGGPLKAPIFRIEGDYCLVAAGENDGVRVGEVFHVRRADPSEPTVLHDVAELTVRTVKVDYCGVDIRMLDHAAAPLRECEPAERLSRQEDAWAPAGIIESVDPATRTAKAAVDPGRDLRAGQPVRWVPEAAAAGRSAAGAAIVLTRAGDDLILAIPPGWGDPAAARLARVDAPTVRAGTTRPASPG